MADMNDNREIKIENLEIDFRIKKGTVSVIKNIDMSVKKGRVTALVGESGSGKSVTSHAVMGLLPMNVKKKINHWKRYADFIGSLIRQ